MTPDLKTFYREYMSGALAMKVPADAVRMLTNSTEVVLYRDGQFQVELITLRKGSSIPSHAHPNIDTYEVILSASELATAVVGKRKHEKRRAVMIVPILHGAVHSAKPGDDKDTALLSIQHWRNGVTPTFITDDWIGGEWL